MLRLSSRYVSTVLEVFLTVLEVCFYHAQGMFRPCSRYFSTVLEICSDHAPVRVRPSFEVCFDRTRGMFCGVRGIF